jgi:hypothetical protein
MQPNRTRRAPSRDAAEAVTGGLEAWLCERRAAGQSYSAIGYELSRLGVVVTSITVRNWCLHFGCNPSAPEDRSVPASSPWSGVTVTDTRDPVPGAVS